MSDVLDHHRLLCDALEVLDEASHPSDRHPGKRMREPGAIAEFDRLLTLEEGAGAPPALGAFTDQLLRVRPAGAYRTQIAALVDRARKVRG